MIATVLFSGFQMQYPAEGQMGRQEHSKKLMNQLYAYDVSSEWNEAVPPQLVAHGTQGVTLQELRIEVSYPTFRATR